METQRTQFAVPAVVDRGNDTVSMLQPLTLSSASGGYDERWLQDVLYAHPELLPMEEIEPVFSDAVPVCRELPTRVGPLDLVYVNKQGLLTLVECKLWRNPEARRQVVGQILDYAQEISRWTFDELNQAISKSEQQAGASLWVIAQQAFGGIDEAAFVDRVSRHLRNGEFLLLIIGDGIRENTENIAAFLDKYAGLSFAFGLVEERLFALPGKDQILVQPRILARTVEIGRLFVRTDAGATIEAESTTLTTKTKAASKGRTLTESVFIDDVAGNSALAAEIRDFFAILKDRDFEIQPTARGASLKVVPIGAKMNLLTLYPDGKVMNFGCGHTAVGRDYLDRLKALLPNARIREAPDAGWTSTVTKADGSYFRIEDIMGIRAPLFELFDDTRRRLDAPTS
jgi:hypothetical protein